MGAKLLDSTKDRNAGPEDGGLMKEDAEASFVTSNHSTRHPRLR
jgi:hypothetical protein